MTSFLESLIAPEGCAVDGSMGRNPISDTLDTLVGNLDVFSFDPLSWESNQEFQFADERDIIYRHESPQYDHGQLIGEQAGHLENWIEQRSLHDHFSTQSHHLGEYPGVMPWQIPNLYPLNYDGFNVEMRASEQFHSNQDPAQTIDTSIVSDSTFIAANPEELALLKQFQSFNTSMPSKEAYHASWQRTLDHLATLDSSFQSNTQNEFILANEHTISSGTADEKEELFSELLEKGMELFRLGDIARAMKAFEAAKQLRPDASDPLHMLGICHMENDDDIQAIACFQQSLANDQYNLDSLLSLSMCYVNELNSIRALETLREWVSHNPSFYGLNVPLDEYSDGTLMDEVVKMMEVVSELAPHDRDVKVVLGVLYNVTSDYSRAADSFRSALGTDSQNYSLLNKIGASLANNNDCVSSIPYYLKAVKIRPKYARGWLNLGIAHNNLKEYEKAAAAYVQALNINPGAQHIWSYLRASLSYLNRFDLVESTTRRDIAELASKLNVQLVITPEVA